MKFYFEEIPVEDDDVSLKVTENQSEIQKASKKPSSSSPYTITTLPSGGGMKAPAGRGGSTLTLVNNKLYIIGGADREATHYNEVCVYDLEKKCWEACHNDGTTFTARSGHSAVAVGSLIYVFGGINLKEQKVFNDLLIFDTAQMKWTDIKLSSSPPARNSHTAVLVNDTILIFGGSSPMAGPMNDLYALHGISDNNFSSSSLKWEKIQTTECPSARELHAACAQSNVMYVSGGRDSTGNAMPDCWAFNTNAMTWSSKTEMTVSLCSHNMYSFHNSLLTFGGFDGGMAVLNDLWSYDTSSLKWVKETPNGKDIAVRFGHAGVSSSSNIIYVFGGMNIATDLSSIQLIQYN